MDVTVVGRGVVGLSICHELAAAGHSVHCVAAGPGQTPPHALWEQPPYRVTPRNRVAPWAQLTLPFFLSLPADIARPCRSYQIVEHNDAAGLDALAPVRRMAHELPNYSDNAATEPQLVAMVGPEARRFAVVTAYDAVVVDSRALLATLHTECQALGVTFESREVEHGGAEREPGDVVVVAAGLGSTHVAPAGGEPPLIPVRGQVCSLASPFSDPAALENYTTGSYCIPFAGTLELGGTAEPGHMDRRVSETDTADIKRRADAMMPALRGVPVEDAWVGLRPTREGGVRVERQGRIIHVAGLGGAGFTVSHGLAKEVRAMLTATAKL